MSARMYMHQHTLFHLTTLAQRLVGDVHTDEILKLEEEIIRDEEFISQLDNSEFRSLREIVTEIIETLSLNTNH